MTKTGTCQKIFRALRQAQKQFLVNISKTTGTRVKQTPGNDSAAQNTPIMIPNMTEMDKIRNFEFSDPPMEPKISFWPISRKVKVLVT